MTKEFRTYVGGRRPHAVRHQRRDRPVPPARRTASTPDIVREISAKKDEPSWMLDLRLKALDTYQRMPMAPDWGPGLEGLDMDHIVTYVKPATDQQAKIGKASPTM